MGCSALVLFWLLWCGFQQRRIQRTLPPGPIVGSFFLHLGVSVQGVRLEGLFGNCQDVVGISHIRDFVDLLST